ncbi:ABC transporter permease [Thermoproteota archaeon]
MEWKKIIYLILSFVILLLVWQISVTLFEVNDALFPSPVQVINALFESTDILFDSAASIARLIVGATAGIVIGVMFGIFSGKFEIIDHTLGGVANFFRFIPPLALVPLFLVWFGIDEFSKVSLLAWTTFFPVWISTFSGVKNIESRYLLVAKSLNMKGLTILKEVILKGSMGYILNGIRVGVGIAFSVLVAAEMLGAYTGLGFRISFFQSVYRVDKMIAYILVLGVLGLIFDKGIKMLSIRLTPWKNED